MNKNLSRRRLMQLLTTTMVGAALPESGIAGASFAATESGSLDNPQPVFIPPGGGQKGKIGASDIVFKLDKTQTSGTVGSTEMVLYPGYLGAPPHYHKGFDEICIVQEGAVHIMVGEEVVVVPAGGWHLRPRGITHTFWNGSDKPAKFIELCCPGGHEQYMKELANLFENGSRPKPDDLAKLAQRHDIVFEFEKLQPIMEKYKLRL